MKRKPLGWRKEPYRHSLARHGISTQSRGIRKKAQIHTHSFLETFHPRTLSNFVYRDKLAFANDKAYEALDRSNWDPEAAYDFLNLELEDLRSEYTQTKDENVKLQMDVIQQAKVSMDSEETIEYLKNEWPEKREKVFEKYYGDQMQSSSRPIVPDIEGEGSFDVNPSRPSEGSTIDRTEVKNGYIIKDAVYEVYEGFTKDGNYLGGFRTFRECEQAIEDY